MDIATGTVEGLPISYVMPGVSKTASNAAAIVGDFSMGIIGVRRHLRFKLLDQAVITDDTGAIIYNLPQQDMVAMRVIARFAYAVANPAMRGGASGYPVAVVTEAWRQRRGPARFHRACRAGLAHARSLRI